LVNNEKPKTNRQGRFIIDDEARRVLDDDNDLAAVKILKEMTNDRSCFAITGFCERVIPMTMRTWRLVLRSFWETKL
jgi:hypothetical protein